MPVANVTKSFITAGKAVFTVKSASGEWYTYRVKHKPASGQYAPAWFASLLTGPDNTSSYTYLGMLNADTGEVRLTAKSPYREDSKPVQVLRWAIKMSFTQQVLPEGYAIHHEGRCGRCGRALTVPSSIESGIGPECASKMGG